MQGKRKYPDASGELLLAEGEFGLHPLAGWLCRPPGCHTGSLANHAVLEHEDGTITVSPSIQVTYGNGFQWHGYLEHGVWRQV